MSRPSPYAKIETPSNPITPKTMTKRGKDFWGPRIWDTIHILALTLKPGDGRYFIQFLDSLTHLLPCEECRENLRKKLIELPPERYVTNNYDAFHYTYILHDKANRQISSMPGAVPKHSPAFEEVKRLYTVALGDDCKSCRA